MQEQLEQILHQLESDHEWVHGALVVSNDGLTMASTYSESQSDQTAAVAASMFDRTDRIAGRSGLGSNQETVLAGELNSYVIVRAGTDGLLIVQADAESMLSTIRHRAQSAARHVAAILTGS